MIKVNEYFQGNVKSLTLQAKDTNATVGVILAGQYEFDTSKKEVMMIVSGNLYVKLPNEVDYKLYESNSSFTVEAGKIFHVKCDSDVSYLCLYY
jgi:purine/pyrimidine-nucleoside phosphorylase